MQKIQSTDPRLTWSGTVSLQHGPGWVQPWRLPCDRLDLFPPQVLQQRAAACSGVRLRLASNTRTIRYMVKPLEAEEGRFDLYINDQLHQVLHTKRGQTALEFHNLPVGRKTLELWLYQFSALYLTGLMLDRGAGLYRAPDRRPKWITYGSSITHCRTAPSPSFTWPGVVARTAGLNLTSLGFGGQCHIDPMIARLIRDLPADFISLKLGINVYGQNSLNTRSFRPAVIGTIATIREKHRLTPLVVCSPIWGAHRETTPNKADMTLPVMRREIAAAIRAFIARGDRNLYYLDGRKLFGARLKRYLPDNLHPDAGGYLRLGQNFHREVFVKLGLKL